MLCDKQILELFHSIEVTIAYFVAAPKKATISNRNKKSQNCVLSGEETHVLILLFGS